MGPLARILICMALAGSLAALGGNAYANGDHDGGGTPGESRSLNLEDFFTQGDDVVVTEDCNRDGVSTVSYRTSGVATGPYPGPFTAEGMLTIGAQVFPGQREVTVAGPLLTFAESFTIVSGSTRITGTKTLAPDQPIEQSQGTCHDVANVPLFIFPDARGSIVEVATQARWQATISEPGGTFRDAGDALLTVSELELSGTCPSGTCSQRVAGFTQTFFSDAPGLDPGSDDDDDDDDDDD